MIIIDFEYKCPNNDWSRAELVSCAVKVQGDPQIKFFRLDTEQSKQDFRSWWKTLSDPEIVVYNANAEICSLLKLNLTWSKVIDLWVECKMFMMTQSEFYTNGTGLADMIKMVAKKFNKPELLKYAGKDVRDLIINHENYTKEQWEQIEAYNIRDVEALVHLWNIFIKPQMKEHQVTIKQMQYRGEFCEACAVALFNTKGFPIDKTFLDTVYDNKEKILTALYQKVNQTAGVDIYIHTAGRQTKGNKRYPSRWIAERWTFNQKNFEKMLKQQDLFDIWQKTEKGYAAKSDDAFSKFLSNYKNYAVIDKLYECINTEKAFKSTDYRDIMTPEGYVKPPSFPFHQKSGRSSPKPKLGFALNLQPWMRRMIKPKPGMVLIGADWGKQEIAVAAALSGDENYKHDYYTDIYTANARLCGLLGPEEEDPEIRQKFKSIVLGMGYGKQEYSVARDLQVIFGMTEERADTVAAKLFEMREERYEKYCDWVKDTIEDSYTDGVYRTVDDWLYFVDRYTKRTQLQNLPMQSNGAAIMRRGFIRAVDAGLDVVCSLHDALYINAKEERVEQAKDTLVECMRLAVKDILGDKITIENDVDIYYSTDRYKDPQKRDVETLKRLSEFVPEFKNYI